MADAKTLETAAQKVETQQEKPLPTLAAPTVSLPMEIRQTIALRQKELGESFSISTTKLWVELLKKEKRIAADLEIDLTPKRGGGFAVLKEAKETLENEVARLKAELAKAQAKKG